MLKPGLHIVGRIVSMCLRPCPKDHITTLQVSIAKISCERLLLSKTYITRSKKLRLNHSIILTESLVHGELFKISSIIPSVFVTHILTFANSCCRSWNEFYFPDRSGQVNQFTAIIFNGKLMRAMSRKGVSNCFAIYISDKDLKYNFRQGWRHAFSGYCDHCSWKKLNN